MTSIPDYRSHLANNSLLSVPHIDVLAAALDKSHEVEVHKSSLVNTPPLPSQHIIFECNNDLFCWIFDPVKPGGLK